MDLLLFFVKLFQMLLEKGKSDTTNNSTIIISNVHLTTVTFNSATLFSCKRGLNSQVLFCFFWGGWGGWRFEETLWDNFNITFVQRLSILMSTIVCPEIWKSKQRAAAPLINMIIIENCGFAAMTKINKLTMNFAYTQFYSLSLLFIFIFLFY